MKNFLRLAFAVSALALHAQTNGGTISHGQEAERIIALVRGSDFKIGKHGTVDTKQIDRKLVHLNDLYISSLQDAKIIREQNEQGGSKPVPSGQEEMTNLTIRFSELFQLEDDNLLFPVTERTATFAPESSFVGLMVYRGNGSDVSRIVRREKIWHSGVSQNPTQNRRPYFRTELRGADGDLITSAAYSAYVRWGEIKNKIAFSTTQKKLDEDEELERQALRP